MDSNVSATAEQLAELMEQIDLNSHEEQFGGDGRDSNAEGEEFQEHFQEKGFVEEKTDGQVTEEAADLESSAKFYEHEAHVNLTEQGGANAIGRMGVENGLGQSTTTVIDDEETEIKRVNIHSPPDDWVPKEAEPE